MSLEVQVADISAYKFTKIRVTDYKALGVNKRQQNHDKMAVGCTSELARV